MSDRPSWPGWPHPDDLPTPPERLVLHWTAGGHRAHDHELLRYHALIEHREGDPGNPDDDHVRVLQGVPAERNCGDVSAPAAHQDPETGYAAHVRLFNSGSIGMAVCAMRGAIDQRPDGPVDPGPSPLTRVQVTALISRSIEWCAIYGYRPTENRVMTHREVETIHGVDQRGKWDISWLPFGDFGPDEVGPFLREQVQRGLDGEPWGAEMRADSAENPESHAAGMVA